MTACKGRFSPSTKSSLKVPLTTNVCWPCSFCFFCSIGCDRVLLCNLAGLAWNLLCRPDQPPAHRDPLVCIQRVLGLQVWATKPSFGFLFKLFKAEQSKMFCIRILVTLPPPLLRMCYKLRVVVNAFKPSTLEAREPGPQS